MIRFEQAIETILAHSRPGQRTRELPIEQAADFVLAEEICADLDMPAFDRSAMDGFAFRHGDHAPERPLRIVATIAAGELRETPLGSGECVKIMTGAPVPPDADTVVQVEDTSAFAGEPGADGTHQRLAFVPDCGPGTEVRFHRIPARGANVARRGENLRDGQTVLRPGTLLAAQEIAILAAVGHRRVRVHAGPQVAFGATGEEIVEPGEPLAAGQIRNSNGYTLWSQLIGARAEPHYLGIIGDRDEQLRERIAAGLEHDILVLSGGVSMGEFDLVPQILAEAGVNLHFRKLRVRPGRPMLFGTRGKTLVFGLPGNPISTLYACDQYVLPAMRVFRHHPQPLAPLCRGRLTKTVRTPEDWLTFIACRTAWRDDEYWLTPRTTRGSADIFAIAGADALAMIPIGTGEVAAGEAAPFRKLYLP